MGVLDRLFDGGSEKRVLEAGKGILDHAIEANKLLVFVIDGSTDIQGLRGIEKFADGKVFELTNSITSGAIAPNLIDDMIRLVRNEDRIVDAIFNLARAIARYTPEKKTQEYVKKHLTKQSELINKSVLLLYEMHKIDTIAAARSLRVKIEEIEQESDDIKDAMLDYSYAARLEFKDFYYIQDVAHRADDVLDACEISADMIVSVLSSILT